MMAILEVFDSKNWFLHLEEMEIDQYLVEACFDSVY